MVRVRLLISTSAAVLLMLGGAGAQSIYVTNPNAPHNTVAVIDSSSNTIIDMVPVGLSPTDLAITPDGTRLYVTNLDNTISVIDTSTNTVVDTVAGIQFPTFVAITPDGTRAYVTSEQPASLSVIDTSTNTVVATVPTGIPEALGITPDGTRVYVAITGFPFDTVWVLDTSTNRLVAVVPGVGFNVRGGLVFSPDGTRAYVASQIGDGMPPGIVSVIDTSANTVVATVQLSTDIFGIGYEPASMAITPDGSRAYVANWDFQGPGNVSVVDTSTNTLVTTITDGIGRHPFGVAISPDGTRAYVTESNFEQVGLPPGPGNVSVIDTSTNTVVATVPGLDQPGAVAISYAVPFTSFSANLDISSTGFDMTGTFGAGGTINPVIQPLTLKVGTYRVTVPIALFKAGTKGTFTFKGTLNGTVQIRIASAGGNSYSILVKVSGVNLTSLNNPVPVSLTIGTNTGTTSATANFN